jgi:hypothetical protein
MHVTPGYPLYCAEANARKYFYFPPSGGVYPNGWLWIDGDQHATAAWWTWDTLIMARMNRPAAVDIRLWGYYSSANRTGAVFARFRNDSSATVLGRAILVITEDSLYYPAPNYDSIHNHVARDYLPDQNGLALSVAPGDSAVASQPFVLAADWVVSNCRIIAWIQSDSARPDSTKGVWQGAMIPISALPIAEVKDEPLTGGMRAKPNPCSHEVNMSFISARTEPYSVRIYDISGSIIREFVFSGDKARETLTWDLKDHGGCRVASGVYFCVAESGKSRSTLKIVVR